jgi:hypothetical protein
MHRRSIASGQYKEQSFVQWIRELDRRRFLPHIIDVRRMGDVLVAKRGQNPTRNHLARKGITLQLKSCRGCLDNLASTGVWRHVFRGTKVYQSIPRSQRNMMKEDPFVHRVVPCFALIVQAQFLSEELDITILRALVGSVHINLVYPDILLPPRVGFLLQYG